LRTDKEKPGDQRRDWRDKITGGCRSIVHHPKHGSARLTNRARNNCDGVDIFAMGQLHYWLELNTIVLCGCGAPVRTSHHRLIEATETRFYEQPDGGIRDIMDWYALNRGKSVWRRAAGVYIRILSDPQLFIEGNHRTGALIMSYLLARAGRAPFVLTDKDAREYFNPSSVFKKTNKRSVVMRLKMPGLTSALADYLKRQANKAFLVSTESSRAWTGDDRLPANSSWVRMNPNSGARKSLISSSCGREASPSIKGRAQYPRLPRHQSSRPRPRAPRRGARISRC
jgi:hypothetical protein